MLLEILCSLAVDPLRIYATTGGTTHQYHIMSKMAILTTMRASSKSLSPSGF
jgi:hypothetical protein